MPRKTTFSSLNTYEPPKNPWIEQAKEERKEAERKRVNAKRNPPEKIAARAAVHAAIARGEIVKQPCELKFHGCQSWPVEAHHESYSKGKETDIKWACKSCHDKLSSKAWKASFRDELMVGWPRDVIHLTGPQCSGKSHLLRQIGVPASGIWDVLSFYERKGALKQGESFPPRLRLLDPKEWYKRVSGMKKDLKAFLNQGKDVLFVESSGLNRKLNAYLIDHKAEGQFRLVTLCISADDSELERRAMIRGLDLEEMRNFNARWKREADTSNAMCQNDVAVYIKTILEACR